MDKQSDIQNIRELYEQLHSQLIAHGASDTDSDQLTSIVARVIRKIDKRGNTLKRRERVQADIDTITGS